MNSVAAPRLRITVTVYPKARGLALGLTITAAPQLIAQLTQVTLQNAVDYSSILLPFIWVNLCRTPLAEGRSLTSTSDTGTHPFTVTERRALPSRSEERRVGKE